MNTNVAEIIGKALTDMASSNPYVAGGMLAGGILIIAGTWVVKKCKKRKHRKYSKYDK